MQRVGESGWNESATAAKLMQGGRAAYTFYGALTMFSPPPYSPLRVGTAAVHCRALRNEHY
jgi:hypothetical protein